MNTRADVRLWGRTIGAVLWQPERDVGIFGYDPAFLDSGIEIAPFTLPLRRGPFDFPSLPRGTFHGLPGLLADSLPDRFGSALIDRWLAEQGRSADSMDPVERLLYTGRRGMGALEFEPARGGPGRSVDTPVDIAPLVELASRVLTERESLSGVIEGKDDLAALGEILRVGTSAGGARAKAVIAWNPETGQFHSGQLAAGPGYSQWLLKFDGVAGSGDHGLADPKGFGRLEYACYLLARAAGVEMAESRLHEEGGRAHFMTRRFDRTDVAKGQESGPKLHMLSLGAMRHFDFNQPRAYAYEQALDTIRLLGLGQSALAEMTRRAFLNVVIRNQDDHVKNIAFLMDRDGRWRLSPAFDVVHAWNPSGAWTAQHQMALNGKTDGFTRDDLMSFAAKADIKRRAAGNMLDRILEAARDWDRFIAEAGVPASLAKRARAGFRRF